MTSKTTKITASTISKAKSKSKKAAAQPRVATKPNPKNTPTQNQKMEKIMTQNKTQFDAFSKDAANAGREGMDAMMKSTTIFAKGLEDIMRISTSLAKNAAEKQAQYMKDAMGSKTINEWSEAQNKMAQANFDDFMSSATKISEMSIKVLTEASEPVNDQVNKAVKKASGSMAA